MDRRRLGLAAFALAAAAVLIPAVVFAEDPAPKVASITSNAGYTAVDVTFTVPAYTSATTATTTTPSVGSGALTTSDFTVTDKAGSPVTFTVAQIENNKYLGYRLTFPVVAHDTTIAVKADEVYTGAGALFPAETLPAPFATADLTLLLDGLKAVPFVPATGPDLPFVQKWFGTKQSLPELATGLQDVAATATTTTEAQVVDALKGLGAGTTAGSGYISDVTFDGDKATVVFNKNKVAATKTISAQGGAEEVGGKIYNVSLGGNVDVNAALGGSLTLDLTSGSPVVDAASAPQLVLTTASTFSGTGRLGVVEVAAPDTKLDIDAALTMSLECKTAPCTAIGQHTPKLTPSGTAKMTVQQVDVAFGSNTTTFKRDGATPPPLLELTWSDLSDLEKVIATQDHLDSLKLRDFTRISAGEIAGGIQWIGSWLTELEAYGAMAKDLPVVGGSLGKAGTMSRSLAEPAIVLAQVLGAVGDVSAQDLATICTPATYGPLIDSLDRTAEEKATAKANLAEVGSLCDDLLKDAKYDAAANAITYTVSYEVEEDLFKGVAPNMDLGFDELQGIKVTGRSGTWTGEATVNFDMTFGIKLGSATDLGIAGGVLTDDFDGDGIADTADEDDDGDSKPERHTLQAGDRCGALASFLGSSPDKLQKDMTGTAAEKTAACDALLDPTKTVETVALSATKVCTAVAGLYGVEAAHFKTLNGFATDVACSDAVKTGSPTNGPFKWDSATLELGAAAQVPHRIYIEAGDGVTMAADFSGSNIQASAILGILDLGVSGSVDVTPTADFGFVDPGAAGSTKADGKVDLFELARNADANEVGKVVSMDFGGPVAVHLGLANAVLFPGGKGVDVVGDLSALDNAAGSVFEFHTDRVASADTLTADRLHVGHDLDDFMELKDVTPAQALQMIVAALEQLAEMGGSGAMSQTIPFIDVTPADMVGFSADFADIATRIEARAPADISSLESALNEALTAAGMPAEIAVGVTAAELTVTFNGSQSVTRSYPFTLEGADVAFAPADGGASVAATAAVDFNPTIGLNFDAGTTTTPIAMEDRLFVRNVEASFDVDVDAELFGSVVLGPMSAAIEGTASVGDDGSEVTVGLAGAGDDDTMTIGELVTALETPTTALDLTYSGPIAGALEVSTDLGTGTVTVAGNLAEPTKITMDHEFDFELALDLGTFVDGTVQTARFVGRSLEQSEAVTSELPLLGDQLGELVTVGTDIREGADTLADLWEQANATNDDGSNVFLRDAEKELNAALCPGQSCSQLVLLPEGKTPATTFATAKGLELRLHLTQEDTQEVVLDEGMKMDPVFNMDLKISPLVKYGYDLDVVMGMDITDGFYVKSSKDGGDLVQLYASFNAGVAAEVDLLGLAARVKKNCGDGDDECGNASISGALGPDGKQGGVAIKVGGDDGKLTLREMANRRTKVEDLIAPRFDVDVKAHLPINVDAAGIADLAVPLNFGMNVKGFEVTKPTLTLGCSVDHADLPDGFCDSEQRVELDIQSLVDEVFKPIFGPKLLGNSTYNPLANADIKKTLDDEIPVLNTTLRALLKETAAATGKENEFKLITLLIDISNVNMANVSGKVDLGWAKVTPGWTYYEPEVPIADQGPMGALYGIVDSLRSKTGSTSTTTAKSQAVTTSAAAQPGTGTATQPVAPKPKSAAVRNLANMVSFPIVEDPAAMMNLLRGDVGESVDFFRLEPPPINIGPSINWSRTLFDLDIGFLKGGLTVAFRGNLGLSAELGFGFDSSGISSGEAWKGIYIVDYDGPELSLGGQVAGTIDGHISVLGDIASVRFRGSAGVRLLVGIDLFDDSIALPEGSRNDGRMTIGEMVLINDAYENPMCMFQLGILLDAHLGFGGSAKVLGITVFDKSWSDQWTIVDEQLECELKTRAARLEGRQLILNGGAFADYRYDGEGDVSEDFTITQEASNLRVALTTNKGAAPSMTFPVSAIDEIYGELGAGTNAVRIASDVKVPSRIVGGPNSDTLLGGDKVDNLDGAGGNDIVRGRGDADVLLGGDGNDTLEGGAATDEADGGSGSNTYDFAAGWGDDTIDDGGADATLNFTTATALEGESSYEEGTVTTGTNRLRFDLATVTTILGGTGNDNFGFNRYAPEDFTFDGRGGSDTGTFQTSGIHRRVGMTDTGPAADTDEVVVLGTAAGDTFMLRANGAGTGPAKTGFVALKAPTTPISVDRIDYDDSIDKLNLKGLGGNNRYVLDDTATDLTLDAGDGNNKFQVGQVFAKDRTGANVIDGGGFRTRGVHGRGFLSYGISHKAVINGGDGKDFFTVYSNTAELDLNGGDGDDTFVVRAFIAEGTVEASGGDGNDKFDYIQNKLVTIDGGGGFNTFVAVGTELSDGWHVTKDGLRICPLQDSPSGSLLPRLPGDTGCGINVAYTNIQSIVAHGLNGNDVFWVQSTDTGVHTQLFGGTDGATFYANNTTKGVNNIDGPLTVRGDFDPNFDSAVEDPITLPGENAEPGTEPEIPTYTNQADKLIANAAPHTTDDTGTLTSTRLSGLGMGSGEIIDVGTAEGSRSFPTGIVYDQIDILITQLGSGADTFTVDSTHTYETDGNDAKTVATNSTILGGAKADQIRVRTIAGPTTVNGEAGDDTVRAGTLAPETNGRITGITDLLTVNGGADTDALYADDTAATADTVATVTNATIRGFGMPEGIDYAALETLDLDLGSGADVLNLRGTSAATTVHGRDGDEDFYVASTAALSPSSRVDGVTPDQIETNLLAGDLDDVAGNLTLDAGDGDHLLMVSDRAAGAGDTATLTAGRIADLATGAIDYNAAGTYRRGITVWSSDHADTLAVKRTRFDAGLRTSTVLNAGAGADDVDVALATSQGAFVANLENGDDTLDASTSDLGIMVFGGDGSDDITTGAGGDTAFGDLGTATYGSPAGTVAGHGGTNDYTDGATTPLLELTTRDVCTGAGDQLDLGAGPDVAYGGTGNDSIVGGSGDDSLLGDHGLHRADWITLPAHRSLDSTNADNCSGDDNLLGGPGDDNLMGQAGADTVYGNGVAGTDPNSSAAGDNVITGGHDGAGGLDEGDVLIGGGVNDTIIGDNGSVASGREVLIHDLGCATTCGDVAGGDIIHGIGGADRLFGGVGNDYAVAGADADRMEGGPGNDWLETGTGDDDVIGGSSAPATTTPLRGFDSGDDVILGIAGADVVLGDNGQIRGADGRTTNGAPFTAADPFSTSGSFLTTNHRSVGLFDLADASPTGDDVISAGPGESFVFGQGGGDWISGGAGDDYAEGNAGADVLTGDRALGLTLDQGKVSADLNGLPTVASRSFSGIAASLLELRGSSPVAATTWSAIEGAAGAAGQDDLVGGSSTVGQPSGDDIVYGDGADDVAYGDNATITRAIITSNTDSRLNTTAYAALSAPTYARHDERYPIGEALPAGATAVRRIVEHDIGTSIATTASADAPYGNDFVDGGAGSDAVLGQDGDDELWGGPATDGPAAWGDHVTGGLGDDELFGGQGHDVLVGDRGSIITQYIDPAGKDVRDPAAFSYKSSGAPFASFSAFSPTSLIAPRERHWNRVDLYCGAIRTTSASGLSTPKFVAHGATTCTTGGVATATDDTKTLSHSAASVGGLDVARGGPGDDVVYGGGGNDLLNGDRGLDKVFGGVGDDVLWGGMGHATNLTDPENRYLDLIFGGAGADFLDYRPRVQQAFAGQSGWNNDAIRHDPDEWFDATAPYAHPDTPARMIEDTPQHHQGVSWMYGGVGRDALQASVTSTGPNAGSRMLDWSGLYNLYTHCSPSYGGYNVLRTVNGSTTKFIQNISYLSGASPDLTSGTVAGTSGGDQIGYSSSGQTGSPYTDAHVGGVPGTNYNAFIDCG